jgi:hypothetical protein
MQPAMAKDRGRNQIHLYEIRDDHGAIAVKCSG